ncbi:MAG: glycosyltransferase family 9 protein [Pseudomonadota bacterium]
MSSSPPIILIIRLSAIGDIVFTTALLPALRQRWPDAKITWLTTPIGQELLHEHPLIDEVLVLPKGVRSGPSFAGLAEGWRFAKALRARGFTLAIDAQGLLKSALWTVLSGAPRRVGLRPREGAQLLYTQSVSGRMDEQPDRPSREYRHLAQALGLDVADFPMSLAARDADAQAAAERLGLAKPIFLLPFTTRPQKHWFDDYWAALATQLQAAHSGHPIWLLGGPGDLDHAQRIAAATEGQITVVAGPDSHLGEKIALLARGALSIGVDTGLTHMSIALGRPTLALFGSTCPYVRTDPAPGTVLYDHLDCSPCRRHPTCGGAFTCMREHTPERVLGAARALLEAER